MIATLETFAGTCRNEWPALVAEIQKQPQSYVLLDKLSREADLLAIGYAELSEYLSWRGAVGSDHGERHALKQVARVRKQVRRVLGYAYP